MEHPLQASFVIVYLLALMAVSLVTKALSEDQPQSV